MNGKKFMLELNIRKIEEAIEGGWISKRKHPDANLYILNYTPQTQYEGYWHPDTTMICRGLIVDDKWNVITRPFPKFFSIDQLTEGRNKVHYLYGKKFKTLFDGKFEAYDKADGSLGILYPLGDKVYVATRGSFESEMAIKASQILEDMGYADKEKWRDHNIFFSSDSNHCYLFGKYTFLFEIIYPENRIVVDYGQEEKLILLDVIENSSGKRANVLHTQFEQVKKYDHINTIEDLENENENYDGREGYVLVFEDGFRVKWKYDEYKRLHRILTGLTPNVVFDWVRSGENLEKVLAEVPDEFYNWATDLATVYEAAYREVEDAVKAVYEEVKNKDWTRKDIALAYQDYEHRGLLFAMIDRKDYSDSIWKIVKEKEKENERSRNAPSILD